MNSMAMSKRNSIACWNINVKMDWPGKKEGSKTSTFIPTDVKIVHHQVRHDALIDDLEKSLKEKNIYSYTIEGTFACPKHPSR